MPRIAQVFAEVAQKKEAEEEADHNDEEVAESKRGVEWTPATASPREEPQSDSSVDSPYVDSSGSWEQWEQGHETGQEEDEEQRQLEEEFAQAEFPFGGYRTQEEYEYYEEGICEDLHHEEESVWTTYCHILGLPEAAGAEAQDLLRRELAAFGCYHRPGKGLTKGEIRVVRMVYEKQVGTLQARINTFDDLIDLLADLGIGHTLPEVDKDIYRLMDRPTCSYEEVLKVVAKEMAGRSDTRQYLAFLATALQKHEAKERASNSTRRS